MKVIKYIILYYFRFLNRNEFHNTVYGHAEAAETNFNLLQRQDGILVQLGLVTTPHPVVQMPLMMK